MICCEVSHTNNVWKLKQVKTHLHQSLNEGNSMQHSSGSLLFIMNTSSFFSMQLSVNRQMQASYRHFYMLVAIHSDMINNRLQYRVWYEEEIQLLVTITVCGAKRFYVHDTKWLYDQFRSKQWRLVLGLKWGGRAASGWWNLTVQQLGTNNQRKR